MGINARDIKLSLLNDYIQKRVTFGSQNVNKSARGAALCAVLNYGYHVANRQGFTAGRLEQKESGLQTDFDQEVSYYRWKHPSILSVVYLKSALNRLNPKNNNAFQLIKKWLDTRNHHSQNFMLAKEDTVEQVFEKAFACLSPSEMRFVEKNACINCKNDLEKALPSNQSNNNISNVTAQTVEQISQLQFVDQRLGEVREKALSGSSSSSSSASGPRKLTTYERPKSGYPCYIIEFQNLFKDMGIERAAPQVRSPIVKMMLGYLLALINFYAIKYYGANFIWTQEVGSFGSLRPSMAETGATLRFSPGVVPNDFIQNVFIPAMDKLESDAKGFAKNHQYNSRQGWPPFINDGKKDWELLFFNQLSVNNTNHFQTNHLTSPLGPAKSKEDCIEQLLAARRFSGAASRLAVVDEEIRVLLVKLIGHIRGIKGRFDAGIVGQVDSLIYQATDALASKDFSRCITALEHLIRMYHIMLLRDNASNAEDIEKSNLTPPQALTTLDSNIITQKTISAAGGGMTALRSALTGIRQASDKINKQFTQIRSIDPGSLYFESKDLFADLGITYNSNVNVSGNSVSVCIDDIAGFPHDLKNQKTCPWLDNWGKIVSLPEVLIVDITSGTKEQFEKLLENFKANTGKPYVMITVTSSNKIATLADVVPFGEVKCFTKNTLPPEAVWMNNIQDMIPSNSCLSSIMLAQIMNDLDYRLSTKEDTVVPVTQSGIIAAVRADDLQAESFQATKADLHAAMGSSTSSSSASTYIPSNSRVPNTTTNNNANVIKSKIDSSKK